MLMNVLRKLLNEVVIPEIKWRAVRVRSPGCGARGTPSECDEFILPIAENGNESK